MLFEGEGRATEMPQLKLSCIYYLTLQYVCNVCNVCSVC